MGVYWSIRRPLQITQMMDTDSFVCHLILAFSFILCHSFNTAKQGTDYPLQIQLKTAIFNKGESKWLSKPEFVDIYQPIIKAIWACPTWKRMESWPFVASFIPIRGKQNVTSPADLFLVLFFSVTRWKLYRYLQCRDTLTPSGQLSAW